MNQIFCMCMSFTYSFDSILVNDHGTVIKIVILKQKTATICLVTFCENILFKNRNKTVFPQKNLVNIGQIDMMHCILLVSDTKHQVGGILIFNLSPQPHMYVKNCQRYKTSCKLLRHKFCLTVKLTGRNVKGLRIVLNPLTFKDFLPFLPE